MKETEITKDNYEKYVDLYELKNYGQFIDNNEASDYNNLLLTIFSICFLTTISSFIINSAQGVQLLFGLFTMFGGAISAETNFRVERIRKIKKFKENHPNINSDISLSELEIALENVGLLTRKANSYKIDIDNYLEQLRIEEKKLEEQKILNEYENIKEETFNNNYFIERPIYTSDDQEKAKVKVKQYLKK